MGDGTGVGVGENDGEIGIVVETNRGLDGTEGTWEVDAGKLEEVNRAVNNAVEVGRIVDSIIKGVLVTATLLDIVVRGVLLSRRRDRV